MDDKKEKWEIRYEEIKDIGLKNEQYYMVLENNEKELKEKRDKGIITEEEFQSNIAYKSNRTLYPYLEINKQNDHDAYKKKMKTRKIIRENGPKIEHLIEFKNKLNEMMAELKEELKAREASKISEGLKSKNEELLNKIRNENLSDDEIKKIREEMEENKTKIDENENKSNKISSKYANVSNDDLKNMMQKLSIQKSKVNYYGNRLVKGYDIESIKEAEKNIDFTKKLTAKGKQAKKLDDLKNIVKEEKNIEKTEESKDEEEKNNGEQSVEEQIGDNVQKIMQNEENEEDKEEKAIVEVSEFEQKHPRLAKIKNFLNNIRSKMFNKEVKENAESVKTDDEKTENKEDEIEENEEKVETSSKHKDFVKILKNMDEYEIYDVAQKGMDKIKEERMAEAREKLDANKEKHANGMTADEKEHWDNERKSIESKGQSR